MPLVCFGSPAGGVGRTTLVANVARELSRAGERVIALDLDAQNAMGLHFGLDLRDAFGFLATLRYAADPRSAWRAALRSSPSGVSFLPYGQVGLDGAVDVATSLVERPEMLAAAVRDMLSEPDTLVLADLPSGASPALAAVLPCTDLLVVPLRPEPASAAQLPAVKAGRFSGGLSVSRIGFVLNRWSASSGLGAQIGETLRQHVGDHLLGTVRDDDSVAEALAAQRLVGDVTPRPAVAQDLTQLASRVLQRLRGAHALVATMLPDLALLAETAVTPHPTVAQDTYA